MNKNSICSNCINFEDCKFCKESSEAIYYCNEYRLNCNNSSVKAQDSLFSEDITCSNNETILGLCSNCSKSKICKIDKPTTGIWFCEEYE